MAGLIDAFVSFPPLSSLFDSRGLFHRGRCSPLQLVRDQFFLDALLFGLLLVHQPLCLFGAFCSTRNRISATGPRFSLNSLSWSTPPRSGRSVRFGRPICFFLFCGRDLSPPGAGPLSPFPSLPSLLPLSDRSRFKGTLSPFRVFPFFFCIPSSERPAPPKLFSRSFTLQQRGRSFGSWPSNY